MPKLWNETVDAHRREVREAILDTTARLVVEHGLLSVTMSQIAGQTGIGRATLYKYFSDVAAILTAWHERQLAEHLEQLAQLRDQPGEPGPRLGAVLHAYARLVHDRLVHSHPGSELAAALHQGAHASRAQQHVHELISGLLSAAASAGEVRDDVTPDELATYCLHALSAAERLRSNGAVHRLVAVTLAGLRSTG